MHQKLFPCRLNNVTPADALEDEIVCILLGGWSEKYWIGFEWEMWDDRSCETLHSETSTWGFRKQL